MTTALVAAFLLLHGLAHLPVWLPASGRPAQQSAPFDPRHSWALAFAGLPQSRAVRAAVILASATALLYVIAGTAATTQARGWPVAALTAAASGLVLKALWFNPWLSFGVLLDAGVITAVALNWPGSLY
ncbi:hypothetical protein [Streptomyces flavofungini]|uniref:Integral membrane protein n=1 Tax=Streptomyces flavofungini TaxID=68200 RepID=A0ABS0XF95_9ACTN|nr:hypothetical protein [Streptomyces flavofungini]MBJ3811897.1 hypothetical protein [Streptomyces flavofungini]GHC52624.1 hypothetical protein GCM10010349_18350 [Streptomyces flavofungini]